MTDETSNLALFPISRWPDICPDAFGVELVRIVDDERSLDARTLRLIEVQRAVKARLAATGLPEPMRRDALSDWTRRVLSAEQRALRESRAQ
jgi:hypothetical protein